MIDEILNDSGKLIFIAISLLIIFELVLALVLFTKTKKFLRNSKPAKAIITKLEPFKKGARSHISFQDYIGRAVNTNIVVPAQKYKENEEIEILYLKDKTNKVRVNSFLSLWILPIAMLQSGIMLGVALAVLVSLDIAKLPF